MKNRIFLLLVGVSFLSGCRATARLYPVQGPLSAQAPTPVFLAKVTGAFNSGNMSVVLGDGEVCKGRWSTVPRAEAPKGAAIANSLPTDGMSSAWDTVYGSGFYVSHILGTRLYARSVLTGDRGTVLNVEMYRPAEKESNIRDSIKGVAKDNKDNIYKLAF
jgi:hypothetical protein